MGRGGAREREGEMRSKRWTKLRKEKAGCCWLEEINNNVMLKRC